MLHDQVAHEAKKLAAQQIVKQEKWSDCQREFQKYRPEVTIIRSRTKEEKYTIEVPQKLTESQVDELVSRVVSVLKEKVIH